MKALALTRSYLEAEGLDVLACPSFTDPVDDSEDEATMRMLVTTLYDRSNRSKGSKKKGAGGALRVSSSSEPSKVAGAIAMRTREGTPTFVEAMGPQAVLCAIRSISLARKYLEQESCQLGLAPEFLTSEEGASLLHLHVVAQWWW